MFQVIAVDDEAASLRRIERLLAADSRISHFELFDRSDDAINYVRNHEVNLALLDIEMPGTNGLTLASQLKELYPNIDILFITAYNQYALDAFAVHASGYLLKPISHIDFKRELDIILARHTPIAPSSDRNKIVVNTFGSFSCRVKNSGEYIRFRTVKAEELFIVLLDSTDCTRTKDFLLDTLWPEIEDPDKAGNNFRVTCSYLRKAFADLGFPDVMLRSKEDYSLNLDVIDCDILTFKKAIPEINTLTVAELSHINSLIKRPYLENKFYEWIEDSKSWVEKSSIRFLMREYELRMAAEDYTEADLLLQRLMMIDPYDESLVELYIRLKIKLHSYQQARDIFQDFTNRLMKDLQEVPSAELKKLVDSI